MFLWSTTPRLLVVCIDSLIDQGVVSDAQRKTFGSLDQLKDCVAVSKRSKKLVEKWLEYNSLGLTISRLICKPGDWDPLPIATALQTTNTKASEAVAICGDELEIFEAHAVGLGTILVTRESGGPIDRNAGAKAGPDFILRAGDDGANIFAPEEPLAGFVAEVVAAVGCVPRLKLPVIVQRFIFRNDEDEDTPIHVCGRYFKKSDARFLFHPLSLRLINAKNYPERHVELFRRIIDFWFRMEGDLKAVLVPVPSRQSSVSNVSTLAVERFARDGVSPQAQLLRCTRDYPPQKAAGSYEDRRENVRGVFEVTQNVRGQVVVVLDDITTSFSTLNEARAVLLGAGAERVIPVAVSFHPSGMEWGPDFEYPSCAKCGAEMAPRCKKKDGGLFFGCSDMEAFNAGERHPMTWFREVYAEQLQSKLGVPTG